MKLVIVESPTKAKTISRFLNKDYIIKASIGHVRDLPKNKMGVDIENDFEPQYIISKDKTKIIKELKELSQETDDIYFATDEDREGEAISWHLADVLGVPEKKVKRITFHEITKDAILDALKKPRSIDKNLVDAQQARRILDRLVGYELSPFLWKKVYYGLSAGRVQSVAVRLIVEREVEREQFKTQEYWSITSDFSVLNSEGTFDAELIRINGEKLDKFFINNEAQAKDLELKIKQNKYKVKKIEEKNGKKNPPIPFTTSTLQQEAANKFGYSAKQTMSIAQKLYEGIKIGDEGQVGLITYMRTDSLNLSSKFLDESANYIKNTFGDNYYNGKPRVFKTKSKNAQEAHEAIRPTFVDLSPEKVQKYLDPRGYKIYKLIWDRSIATQMSEAKAKIITIEIENEEKDKFTFKLSGTSIEFLGFLKVYQISVKENLVPKIIINQELVLNNVFLDQHFTEPPARYNDASLIKTLEEYGIGRPSTYATITSTIIDRGYVEKDESRRYKPTDTGRLVNKILCDHFKDIVDIKFTAKIEDDFDEIANNKKEWKPFIKDFYEPFKKNLNLKDKELDKKSLTEEESSEVCDKCGSKMVIKYGRFGKFLACSNYPECKNTKEIASDGTPEKEEILDEKCEKCGANMVVKRGRYGKFIACSNYPECKNVKQNKVSTGLRCPACKDGDIVEKKSRYGKIFYSCSNYPKCTYALWNKPIEDENNIGNIKKCDKCSSALVYYGKDNKIKCSNGECINGNSRKKKH